MNVKMDSESVAVIGAAHAASLLAKRMSTEPTLENAITLDAVHEMADRVRVSAESRLRAVVKELPPLQMTAPPDWFRYGLMSGLVNGRVFHCASDLLAALAARLGRDVPGGYNIREDGTLEIWFEHPSGLVWAVRVPELRWPGVNVRAYVKAGNNHELDVRQFRLAHRVIDHAVEAFNKGDGE